MEKIESKKSVALWFISTSLISIISSVFIYYFLGFFLTNSQTYFYIPSLKILINNSYDFLNQIPAIAISGIMALLTIFFTIIVLSFNLNSKLPDKIIDEYIVYSKRVTIYLSTLSGFLGVQLGVIFFNLYNIYWSYVFVLNLIISIITTIIFFYWFVRITNKKEIFNVLEREIANKITAENSSTLKKYFEGIEDIKVDLIGDYLKITSKSDTPSIAKSEANMIDGNKVPESLGKESSLQHYSAPISGLVQINFNNLTELIKQNKEFIKYLIIPQNKIYVSQMNLIGEFNLNINTKLNVSVLAGKIVNCIKIVDVREFKEINDWLIFLDHSRNNNPKEIENDFGFLKKVLISLIKKSDLHQLESIFDNLENSLNHELKNNAKIFEQIIILFYELRYLYLKDFKLIGIFQRRFKRIIIRYSTLLNNEYSGRYATAILYLSEFVRYDFMKKFEDEKDINTLTTYKSILKDNVEFSNEILSNTINIYFKDSKYYETYLKEHMQQFISGLQFYYEDPHHYNSTYYDSSKEDKKIIDEKCKIIKDIKEEKKIKITNSAFHLLYLIEEKKISQKLSSLVLNFLAYGDIYAEIDPAPSWIMNEELHPEGAFVVPRFPKEKYIITYLIYSDLNKNKIPLPKWEYNKLHLAQELKKNAEEISYRDVLFWFDIKEDKFKENKKKLVDMFSQAITKCNEDEQNKIVNSKIDQNLVNKFEESIDTYFNDNAILRRVFQTNNNYEEKLDKKPKKQPDQSFGFFFTFEKSYFINNPPVSWARTLESDYGMSLARNENEQILKEILAAKKLSKLKQSLEKSIIDGVKRFKNKENMVIIIDDSKDDELNKVPLFTHKYKIQHSLNDEEKHFSFKGLLKYEEIEIPVYEFNVGALIIIDMKNIGKLVQYSPYNGVYKKIYIGIEELNQKDIENTKNIEAPKTTVKVRILEKFRVENISKQSFRAYKLDKQENKPN